MTPEDLHAELELERDLGVPALDAQELDRWEVSRPMTPEDLHHNHRPRRDSERDQWLRRHLERLRAGARVEHALAELAGIELERYLRCTGCSWTFPIDTTAEGERCTQCEGALELVTTAEPPASPAHSQEQFGLSSVDPITTPQEDR